MVESPHTWWLGQLQWGARFPTIHHMRLLHHVFALPSMYFDPCNFIRYQLSGDDVHIKFGIKFNDFPSEGNALSGPPGQAIRPSPVLLQAQYTCISALQLLLSEQPIRDTLLYQSLLLSGQPIRATLLYESQLYHSRATHMGNALSGTPDQAIRSSPVLLQAQCACISALQLPCKPYGSLGDVRELLSEQPIRDTLLYES